MTTSAEAQPVAQPRVQPVARVVVGGVDTHADTHTAALLDTAGRALGNAQFPATPAGYHQLTDWLSGHGTLQAVGVEGTGAYGAGLTRHLAAAGVQVVEVDRPDRKTRRFAGKSDPIDADAAARAVLAGRATIKALLITAPDPVRSALAGLATTRLITACAALRPDRTRAGDPEHATKIALRSLARRHTQLTVEITDLDELLDDLVATVNPRLVAANGVGTDVAGQRLTTAGDDPARLHSEAAFAALCGVAPVPASSGKTSRHRLNRGGDRRANAALYRVVLCRLRWDPRTQDYKKRRTHEGLSIKEIIRCLKRLIARELYYLLINPTPAATPA